MFGNFIDFRYSYMIGLLIALGLFHFEITYLSFLYRRKSAT
jgi:hypothetical protein